MTCLTPRPARPHHLGDEEQGDLRQGLEVEHDHQPGAHERPDAPREGKAPVPRRYKLPGVHVGGGRWDGGVIDDTKGRCHVRAEATPGTVLPSPRARRNQVSAQLDQ